MNSPPDTVKCVETHYFKDNGNPFQRVSRQQVGNSLLSPLAEAGLSSNKLSLFSGHRFSQKNTDKKLQ